MTFKFRNVTTNVDDPVSTWPTEAVATSLERGDITVWRRLASEIDNDPWGKTARQVEEVLSHTRPYGVSELMEKVIRDARSAAERDERETVAKEVLDAIATSGMSREEFARAIGTSTSRLSTYTTAKVTPSAAMMVRIRRAAGEQD